MPIAEFIIGKGYRYKFRSYNYRPAAYRQSVPPRVDAEFIQQGSVNFYTVIFYGVDTNKTFLNQLAFQAVATFDKDIATNMHLNVRYNLFVPYGESLAYVSHRVDAILTAKVNRLIAVTVNGTFLYDKSTAPKPQGTEGMGLGMIYKFP